MEIPWGPAEVIYGITVKPYFFDGDITKNEQDVIKRALPFLAQAPTPPQLMFGEADRKNFYVDQIVAQPDGVFAHGSGLLSLEYKYVGYKPHNIKRWTSEIRLKDMLQCIIAGYTVAQTYKKTTACILRYHNVCYLLADVEPVLVEMLKLVPMAMVYSEDEKRVASSELAAFSENRIKKLFPLPQSARAVEGMAAHDALFKR